MSETVVAVIVTGAVTLVAAFGGQLVANALSARQAAEARRHTRRAEIREVVVELVAAGAALSNGMGQLVFASKIGLDQARAQAIGEPGERFLAANDRFSRASGRVRLTVSDKDIVEALDAIDVVHGSLRAHTSEPATTELLTDGHASTTTVQAALKYLDGFDAALTTLADKAVPLLAEPLGRRPHSPSR